MEFSQAFGHDEAPCVVAIYSLDIFLGSLGVTWRCGDSCDYHSGDIGTRRKGFGVGVGAGREQVKGMLEPAAGTASAKILDTSMVSFIPGSD